MTGRLYALAICLALPLAAPGADVVDAEVASLLERARLWQSRDRPDLARETLDRLFRIAPDQPDGLVLAARIRLRAGEEADAARVLDRLRGAHPAHPGVAQLAALLRIRGEDRDRMRQARQLGRSGRTDEALKAYRALFPDGFPDDELALEYAQLLSASPGGRDQAGILLAELAGRHGDVPAFRLALAVHESRRKPVAPDTLRSLRELSAVAAVSRQARDAWRRAVMGLDEVEESLPALRDYVANDPGDTAVKERLDRLVSAVEQRRRQLADPALRAKREGLALLETGRLDEALARLGQARGDDAEVAGGLGLARLRQGRHGEALAHFLDARRLDSGAGAKWDDLVRTARYWGLLQQARTARESGQWDVAESRLETARGVDPGEPNAAVELARVRERQSRDAEAEHLYREALALAPGNAGALEGLIALLVRADREGEADALIDGLTPALRAEIGGAIDALRTRRLRETAARLQSKARDAEAAVALEQAAAIDLADPWLRLDLARLYAARGEAARGLALFDALRVRQPGDPDTLFAAALFLSNVDRESDALASLERVGAAERTPAMTRLQRRLWTTVEIRRAELLAKGGQQARAAQVREATRAAIGDDVDLMLEMARAYGKAGDDEGARSLLERAAALGPATREQEEAVADFRLSLSLRKADTLLAAGQPDRAWELLADAKQATPAQADRLGFARARSLRALGRGEEAARIYREILRTNPGERDAQLALAGTLIELADLPGARSLVQAALASSPDDPTALDYAGQLALRDGRVDLAIGYRQRSLAAAMARRARGGADPLSRIDPPPVPGGALAIVAVAPEAVEAARQEAGGWRQLAELLDQETGWVSSALDWRSRSGSGGKSRFSAQELPLESKLGWRVGGRWFFRVEAARVNAGALDFADAPEAATFGSVLLCRPLCGAQALPQVERGLALGAGVERGRLRVDLGTSPLGFPVVNLLGGIVHKGEIGPFSFSMDASRRPVASSLLSYAGAKDPGTGRTWGGVVATGVRLGLSRDSGGDHGAWSSLGWHRLGGRNVQDNDRFQAMAGAYRRIINEEDRQLTAGVNAMLWRFSENAGEFTFGHGGYYSPRSYRSLSLPLTWGWRTQRSSFSMRAAVSVSWSETSRAPFYPTDADLQSRAVDLSALTGVVPFHEGGDGGRSFGRSLSAAWERQFTPGLFVGARLELERSTNYEPNRFLVYLRLATDRRAARPVAFPPEPVLPGSQY